jgi:aryl carrier-like protein
MQPAAITLLESLPLNPAGKLDRQALPDPADSRPDGVPYLAARTPLEARLVAAWEAVLGAAPIGVQDNFFALGGASLQAFAIVQRLGQEGLTLPARQLFDHPTVAALAALLEVGEV